MTNSEIKESLKNQFKNQTFSVEEKVSVMKEYNASDLPVYFKWAVDKDEPWLYRARLNEGRIICDLLKTTKEGLEYSFSNLELVFQEDNQQVDQDEWRNAMHKFVNQLK